MSFSTARGHLRPEVTLPVSRATIVFYSSFIDKCRLDVKSAFRLAENGGMTDCGRLERVEPEVTSLFDSFTPIWWAFGIFRLSPTVHKLIEF
jgi:hypothetical protein